MRAEMEEGEPPVKNPIRGIFVGCCAVAIPTHPKVKTRIPTIPSHFRLSILRPSSGQVSGSRLSEQEKPNRIRNILCIYFFLNRFMVSCSDFRFEPET